MCARARAAGALRGRLGDLRPVLGLQLEMGSGAAMWAGDQFDLRQKLRLTRNLALEARPCPPCAVLGSQLQTVGLPPGCPWTHACGGRAPAVMAWARRYAARRSCPCRRRATAWAPTAPWCQWVRAPSTCMSRRSTPCCTCDSGGLARPSTVASAWTCGSGCGIWHSPVGCAALACTLADLPWQYPARRCPARGVMARPEAHF